MTIKIPTPNFDTVVLGSTITCRPDIASRLLHGFLFQVVGTGSPTFAEYVEYMTVNQDNKQKMLIVPAVQRQLDAILDANDDVYDTTMLYVPLTRPGMAFSPWGTKDIGELTIQAKIVGSNPSGKTLTKLQGWMVYTPVTVPKERGDVYLQTVVPVPAGVTGWNEISDVKVKDISSLTKLILSHNAVREVKVSVGEILVYHMTRDAQAEALRRNIMYHCPATSDNAGSALSFHPVVLDDLSIPADFVPLIQNGIRRPLKVEYYWDANVTGTPAAFNMYVEGIERGTVSAAAAAAA